MTLADLSLEQLIDLSEHFSPDVRDVFDFENSVEKSNCIGGPFRKGLKAQIDHMRAGLAPT